MTIRSQPIRTPVPGLQHGIGLGLAVEQLTTTLGVRACASCQRRAVGLDRRILLSPVLRRG